MKHWGVPPPQRQAAPPPDRPTAGPPHRRTAPPPDRPGPPRQRAAQARTGATGAAKAQVGWGGSTSTGELTTMPTDHAPELASLAKRLADAKEFL